MNLHGLQRIIWCAVLSMTVGLRCAAFGEELKDPLFGPTISAADFRNVLAQMRLSHDDAARVQSAYEQFTLDFAAHVAKVRSTYRGLENGDIDQAFWTHSHHQWLLQRHLLERQFEETVLANLDEQSASIWVSAISDVRRRFVLQELNESQRQRFAYDLLVLLDSVEGLDREDEAIATLIAGYRQAMNERIREYEKQRAPIFIAVHEHSRGLKLSEHGKKFKDVHEAMKAWQSQMLGLRVLNDEFVLRIADALPAVQRQAFLDARDRTEYPEVFRPSPPELAIEALRMAEGVSDEKRAALDSIIAECRLALHELNQDIVQTVRRWESGDHPIKREIAEIWRKSERGEIEIEQRIELLADLEPRHPVNPLLKRRHDVGLEAARQMRALFNDAEYQQLPLAAQLALSFR